MNNIKDIIDDNYIVNKYYKKNKITIIDTNKGKYVIKKSNINYNKLYFYLNNKNFNHILPVRVKNDYIIYNYINEVNETDNEKALDLVNLLALLHNKTTFYRQINLDSIKKIYEEQLSELDYLDNYYHELQDIIEQKRYMSPAQYHLIRNISIIYSAIIYSKNIINEWYETKQKLKQERVVLLHNKPKIEHVLIDKNKYLISWDNYTKDIPIYDFLYFYRKDYLNVEMISLFEIYQSKYMYTLDEKLLFISLLTKPWKVELTNNNYSDTKEINKLVEYVIKTREFVLKEYKENQKEK